MDNSVVEKLRSQANVQEEKPSPINVCRYYCFGFDLNPINMEDKKMCVDSYNAILKTHPGYDDLQMPVGYQIHNIGEDTIKDIVLPEYKYDEKTKKYVGKLVKKDLGSNEYLIIPTLFLMILLMRLGHGTKVGNGRFVQGCKLNTNDLDVILRNYVFEPDTEWVECFESPISKRMMGAYEYHENDNTFGLFDMPETTMNSKFGYLLNITFWEMNDAVTGNDSSKNERLAKFASYMLDGKEVTE